MAEDDKKTPPPPPPPRDTRPSSDVFNEKAGQTMDIKKGDKNTSL